MKNGIGDLSDPRVFDYWAKLFREDPEQFHREREAAAGQLISLVPEHRQARLRELQATIDTACESQDPVALAHAFRAVLAGQLHCLGDAYQRLGHAAAKANARMM